MEYNLDKREVKLDRKISELDKFVIDFCDLLGDYVLVSGYVSILFGRSRATEDVDLLVQKMNTSRFKELWDKFYKFGFECLNTSKINEALDMLNGHAIRSARIGKPIPNIEFKFIQNDVQKYSFENKIKVIIRNKHLYISPIEMQIAYKLMLGRKGNKKDIEDAKHILEVFKEKINKDELIVLVDKFGVKEEFELLK